MTMPSKQVATTQQKLQAQALGQLAIIGGQLTKDDDIKFEGRGYVFPERYASDLDGLLHDVNRYVKGQQELVLVERTFDYRPMDGAYATYNCLKQYFGYAQSVAKKGVFGPEPPQELTIDIGYVNGKLMKETVPWGEMILPGLPGSRLSLTMTRSHKGDLFRLVAKVRKADKVVVDGFYNVVQMFLEEHSIYRGKCIDGGMAFFDTDRVDPGLFVYSEDVWAQAETNILSPLRDRAAIERAGLSLKRVTLLEGPFGTGKSGLGRTAQKVAVANGVTAIFCRPGEDDPLDIIKTALLYPPALVFIEDIDIIARQRDPEMVTRILDVFDGPTMKNVPITVVMTTNHVEEIHKGMMRSGRIDAIVSIGAMDRPGVERLAEIVIGDNLADDINYDVVFEATSGFMPAYVKEALERAVRYTIARTGEAGEVNQTDLVNALHSLRAQYHLQEAASDMIEKLPPLDRIMAQMISEYGQPDGDTLAGVVDSVVYNRLEGAQLIDYDSGDVTHNIATSS
jgi:transitional endoplasmic reticulum ATPase